MAPLITQYPTQSRPGISCHNVLTCVAMQNLDNQIWKSRVSIFTKLKLYNTCILLTFLYSSECWAVTKKDAHKIDALNQWCLCKLLEIKWYHRVWNDDARHTTKQLHLLSIVQVWHLSVVQPDENRCQADLNSLPLGELEETTGMS